MESRVQPACAPAASRRPWLALTLAAEAWATLLTARLLVRFRLRRIAGWALRPGAAKLQTAPLPLQLRISRAVRRATSALPGESLCLPQAITGKWMLERRGFRSEIHLGVNRRQMSPEHPDALRAHAWLDAGGPVLTGRESVGQFTRIGKHSG